MKYLPIIAILALAACGGAQDATSTPTTVTETLPAPAPVTVTENVVPQSCLDVIEDMSQLRDIAVEFTHAIVKFPQLVFDATNAGVRRDPAAIDAITARMKAISAQVNANTDKVAALNLTNSTHIADCKAGK
jgi:uncharacterized protein YjaG (DUF416 family)